MAKKQITFFTALFISILFVVNTGLPAAPSAIITGIIEDAKSGDVLWGANVIIVGTSLGGSSDLNGRYRIQNVPFGTYTLRVTYIGYEQQEVSIEVTSERTIEKDFSMQPDVIEGETVVVTSQREGQIAAINKQITSDAIKNIVSSDKIQELPESNAAEAVGRLPGISLQREGGEGNKVVIRGLAPKYNKVQIDGVDMAGTDSDDRSTDLSMISPYMLDGIEVSKTAMADQNADQLGGTVNFLLRGAPFGKQTYTILAEGGYNGLRNEYKDYKIGGLGSLRILNELIGISLNIDIEKRNRSSNTVSAGYKYFVEDGLTSVNSLNVEDISRRLERYNGSLVLDYKTPTTGIFLSNLVSRVDHLNISRSESSDEVQGTASSTRTQYLTNSESNTTILMNLLRMEQYFGNFKFDAGISYAYSKTDLPEELGYGGVEASPLAKPLSRTTPPDQVPNYMKNDVSQILLTSFNDSNSLTKEDELGSYLNLHWEYNLADQLNLKLQAGGQYKHQSRKYDYNVIYLNTSTDPSTIVNEAIIAKWPWMASYERGGSFTYEPFIDANYDPGDFMNGEYKIERVPNLEMGKELIHYLEDYLGVDWGGVTTPQRFVPDFHASKRNDYNGKEDYWAAYLLPTLSIGNQITFIPGIRYEKNKTVYTGVRGDGGRIREPSIGFAYYEKTVTREDEFFLPMIHARYKPLDWFDVRASYTQTLSRPSYTEFLPSWYIYPQPLAIDYQNPNLKPAKSQNYDLYFSFYGNKIGLFTLGLFTKRIDDLIFSDSRTILSDTMAIEEYGLTEEETGIDPIAFRGKKIFSYINNPNKVDVKGIEVEWQSNLWYLPGLLKNVVFGINYTYTWSETKYPRTVPVKTIVRDPFPREVIVGNLDSSYTAPLLFQPDHILNLTLGYDYEGFSIRASMQFKSKIFSQNDWRPQLRGYTDQFNIFDLAVVQKLPIQGLALYGNLKNFTKTIETDINEGTGFMSNKEYYGLSGNFGARYEF